MNSELLVKIVNSILAILGIWTAVSVTKASISVRGAADSLAGLVSLPSRRSHETSSYVSPGVQKVVPPDCVPDSQKERVPASDAGRH